MLILLKILLSCAAIYVAWCAVLFVLQRRMIYPASRAMVDLPAGFERWEVGDGLAGYRRETGARDALFFLHGNGGNARGWAHAADAFPGDVYMLEYPGYGERPGSPTEASLKASALAAFDALPAHERTVVCGQSLGTGVAEVLLRERARRISLLVLATPFTSLEDVAKASQPIVPVGLLLRDKYPLLEAWRSYAGRSCVLVAEHDQIVPRKLSDQFLKARGPDRQALVMPGTDHNSVGIRRDQWEALLAGKPMF